MGYKSTLPQVDHGIDVCGDEWDEEPVIYEKKFDPKHPYCTNWVKNERRSTGIHSGSDDNNDDPNDSN